MDVKVEPKRDEWMTTLPPERKVRPSFNYGLVIIVNLIALALVLSYQNLEFLCMSPSSEMNYNIVIFTYKALGVIFSSVQT